MTVISDIRVYCVHYCLIYVRDALRHKPQKCQRVLSVACPCARKPLSTFILLSALKYATGSYSNLRHQDEVCPLLWEMLSDINLRTLRVVKLCFFTILSMYISMGGQCLQCYTLPVITFCLSLLNAIAGYFVFRWFGKWRLINFKGKAPTTPISWENKVLEAG